MLLGEPRVMICVMLFALVFVGVSGMDATEAASRVLVGIKLHSRKDIILDDKVGKLHCRLVMSFFSSCFCACIKQRVHIAKHIQYKKALNAVGLSFLSIDCPSPTRQFNMIVVVFGLIFFYCLHLFTTHKMSPTIVCYVYL